MLKLYKIENKPLEKTPIIDDIYGIKTDFINEIPEEYLATFYRNQQNLKMEVAESNEQMSLVNATAEYNINENRIKYIDRPDIKKHFYHELLHMSSTIVGKECIYTGFAQIDKETKYGIGVGLTEGMTVFADYYYFKKLHEDGREYSLLSYMMQTLYMVFGDVLLKWYFNSNLPALYRNLVNIMGVKATDEFIFSMDDLNLCLYKTKNAHKLLIIRAYRSCLLYIETMLMKIIYDKYKNGEINKEQFEKAIQYQYTDIERKLKTQNGEITIIFDQELKHILKKIKKDN